MADQQYDFQLGGRGFMLARGRNKGRAWRRTSVASVPGASSADEARYSTTAPNIRFKEVIDDFSGGFGYAYRTVAPANGIHWSENMDCRWPGQAVHCQQALTCTLYDPFDGNQIGGVSWFADLSLSQPTPEQGFGAVFAYGRRENLVSDVDGYALYPRSDLFPPALTASPRSTTTRNSNEGPPALFGSFLYVGGSSGNFHQFDVEGDNKVDGPGAGHQFHGFVNAGNRLYAAVGPRRRPAALRSVAAGADPLTEANWSATLILGNGRGPIQDMVALGGQVFCGTPDGIYAGDQTGTFANVTGRVGQNANVDNFRSLVVHDGRVVGQHVGGILAHDPTNTTGPRIEQIAPRVMSARSPVRGMASALASFGGWLYAGVYNGSQSYLAAGRKDTTGDWRWHTLQRMPQPGRIGRMHIDGITAGSGLPVHGLPNRFWAAMDGSFGNMLGNVGSAPLYFWPMPATDGNPLAPDAVFSANYAGSARLVIPAIDRGAPGVKKVGEAVEVWADGLEPNTRYADVYYTPDRGARTLLGRAQTSPVSTLLMGSLNGSFPIWRSLEVELESFNTTPGTCQVYRSIVVTGNLRPDYVETIEAMVSIADDLPDRHGTPMRPGSVQIDDLRDFASPLRRGGQPHMLSDLTGAQSHVVLDGMPIETESYQEGSEAPELIAQITMVLMTLSQNTQ